MRNPVIIIPARMDSTRLPGKPLADIGGKPMIVRVMERAMAANIAPVYIACAEAAIAEAITAAGGNAILTDPAHPSGTDRIYEALTRIDRQNSYDAIINVQGDLPLLDCSLPQIALSLLDNPRTDIATLAVPMNSDEDCNNPDIVKAVIAQDGRALYFSRAAIPYGPGACYHHIGLYAFKRAALEYFVSLPASVLEQREKLEQLRALEYGLQMNVGIVDTVPFGVDTPEDLAVARDRFLEKI